MKRVIYERVGSGSEVNSKAEILRLNRRSFIAASTGAVVSTGFLGRGMAASEQATDDLIYASATAQANAIRSRRVSSEEVVKAHLDRIQAVNPKINAVITHTAERAIQEARQADADLAKGVWRGPLHGVPMTIKDSFDTAGVRSTAGTLGRKEHIPNKDATAVARLRAAGAILLGKTNTPELTLSYATDNLLFGRTNNPYDLSRTPGGSSGGAAAIIAAGGSPFDVGSDTGGSIRVPAHFCGIAGIKPTWGRTPRTGHIVSCGTGVMDWLTQIGPLARYVEDLTNLLPIIAGPDDKDPTVVPMPLRHPSYVKIRDLRLMFHTDSGFAAPTDETKKTVASAVEKLAAAGARVEERSPNLLKKATDFGIRMWFGDGGEATRALLDEVGSHHRSRGLGWMAGAKAISGPEFSEALRQWQRFKADMQAFFKGFDVIICPVNAYGSLLHEDVEEAVQNLAYAYTFIHNLTGLPAAVVRAGTTEDGMPIGVQIVAQPWREDVALAVAKHLETELGGWRKPNI